MSLGLVAAAFVVLLLGVGVWAAAERPISILWTLPLLHFSIGPPIGLIVWAVTRRTDARLARAALVMQTLGMCLAILAIALGHARTR